MDNCPNCSKEFQFDLYVTYEPISVGHADFRDIECPHCGHEFSEYED